MSKSILGNLAFGRENLGDSGLVNEFSDTPPKTKSKKKKKLVCTLLNSLKTSALQEMLRIKKTKLSHRTQTQDILNATCKA